MLWWMIGWPFRTMILHIGRAIQPQHHFALRAKPQKMRFLLLSAAAAFFSFGSSGVRAFPDHAKLDEAFRRPTSLAPSRYSLKLSFDPDKTWHESSVTIHFHVRQSTRQLVLHAFQLR